MLPSEASVSTSVPKIGHLPRARYPCDVQRVLIATDSEQVYSDVEAALGSKDRQLIRVRAGREVRKSVEANDPDLVILDLQIGNMGGVAACLDLRLEMGAGRIPETAVLLLLDRDADVFIADQSGADSWLIKPIEARSLRKAAEATVAGEFIRQRSELGAQP